MSRHLKNIVMSGLKNIISSYVPSPAVSTPPARGVRYFRPTTDVNFLWGAMDNLKKGRKRRKHIIVRRYPHMGNRLLQLYTYHFPKTWSAACIANREIIKEAQRRAHALEHDCSYAAIEWHIRFLKHYFRVFKGGAKPEPGLKPYSRFYQYTYVCIYRELKAAQSAQLAAQSAQLAPQASMTNNQLPITNALPSGEAHIDDVTFDPIDHRPLRSRRTYPLQHLIARNPSDASPPVPLWQDFCQIIT